MIRLSYQRKVKFGKFGRDVPLLDSQASRTMGVDGQRIQDFGPVGRSNCNTNTASRCRAKAATGDQVNRFFGKTDVVCYVKKAWRYALNFMIGIFLVSVQSVEINRPLRRNSEAQPRGHVDSLCVSVNVREVEAIAVAGVTVISGKL